MKKRPLSSNIKLMKTKDQLLQSLASTLHNIFNISVDIKQLRLSVPPDEKFGDAALACFDLAKELKQNPAALAAKLAQNFPAHPYIKSLKNLGPYLNIFFSPDYFSNLLEEISKDKNFGQPKTKPKQKIVLEFSQPNTNKPQHIGHLRNDLLGQSLVNIFRDCGQEVIAANIFNDRGIHIVKSMLAWQEFAHGETPQSSGLKGDHLVGKYYVRFGQELAKERKNYCQKNNLDFSKLSALEARQAEEKFLAQSQWMAKARDMLIRWEADDQKVRQLWQTMNSWVYEGYKQTYDRLGIKFDKVYYESQTYLLGKDLIQKGLVQKIFYKKEDGSVWVDLKEFGLEEKLLLRSDGTSVYITQDLGTAASRYKEFKFDQAVYVVASEQDYHFKVLFATLKKLGFDWADKLYHLSYGMVSLPQGRIKSRQGQTADADELMDAVYKKAREVMAAAQKQINTSPEEEESIAEIVGLGALKFFMLGTNPQKDIVFRPEESISFDGYTGPFVQYTYARINQLLLKSGQKKFDRLPADYNFNAEEEKLIKAVSHYPEILLEAADNYNPAILAQYLFNLAKLYNNFYQQHSVLQAESENTKQMRLALSLQTKNVLQKGLNLLGIEAPEVM